MSRSRITSRPWQCPICSSWRICSPIAKLPIVALAQTHAVRLLVTHRGGMREVRGLAEDPKLFHQVRSTNAMNQAHYQRHARQVRADFAREVAQPRLERLAERTPCH